MARIPQAQFIEAYRIVRANPNKYDMWGYEFGRNKCYTLWYSKQKCTLSHYNTIIYECNFKTKKFKIGGWSKSDADAINSMAKLTGIGGAYIKDGVLYPWK